MSLPGRYLRTLRHLRGSQITWRLRYTLRRRMGSALRPSEIVETPDPAPATLLALRDHARLRQAALPPEPGVIESWRAGRFRFLNETISSSDGVPWEAAQSQSRLWQYQLQYFDYARAFAIENSDVTWDEDRVLLRAWIKSWIDANPVGSDIAWDAFTISARLMNWSMAEAVFRFEDSEILDSMAVQTEWLLRNLEYDIGANHLLKNAVALTVAGELLGSKAAETGADLLKREVREQILKDGGHYERSPMYHAMVLDDLLLAHAVLEGKKDWLRSAILRMAGWLDSVCHPDDDIPLFCDAALGEAPPPRQLVDLASRALGRPPQPVADRGGASYALPESGYYVLAPEHRRGWMILKACGAAPDHQPGHSHNDVLSYEFSAAGTRMIVDSGVHGYADSPHRDTCRSTAAHNTVQIDGREQQECWSVFRVGHRARVALIDWTGNALEAAHDGFRPAMHRRRVAFDGSTRWDVFDTIDGRAGAAWKSYVHLHPEAIVAELPNGEGIEVTRGDAVLRIESGSDTEWILHRPGEDGAGLYCPRFGEAIPAPVMVLSPAAGSPTLSYAIVVSGNDS